MIDTLIILLDIDDCLTNPCRNNGVCVDGVNAFTCNCARGYTGDDCSESKSHHELLYLTIYT